MLTYIILVAVR